MKPIAFLCALCMTASSALAQGAGVPGSAPANPPVKTVAAAQNNPQVPAAGVAQKDEDDDDKVGGWLISGSDLAIIGGIGVIAAVAAAAMLGDGDGPTHTTAE
ncbi:hypothetical protein [Oceanicella actignis]|uniref:Uncharacterized protein n=1 Tax=Oceanicella actignis TaxID=1189325 RepID=A0A1M7T5Y6_9RHOB|nr:hypothetical protein [Oceanicella actignis]TYO84848.1 hypothetical protein LY05_02821 [Oceanicella actignis]SET43912.1 hypothetical protein SAMN04488119_104213 [Oceanicella actignis]SHN66129.1 hypothetical protein SAMN05216200_104213 [Oceanicella actignis]